VKAVFSILFLFAVRPTAKGDPFG